MTRLATETGAGQWGSSLAFAGQVFGLEVEVYMVKVSYEQKPYRRALMEAFGARCVPEPVTETNSGRAILEEHPDSTGSLGIAISEAVEIAATRDDTKYSLGSVLNHVLMHQSVIGDEAQAQLEQADDYPDIVIGCTGGGSNFAGISFPFIGQALRDGKELRVIAVEPSACPSLTKGLYAYDFGDTGHLTPLVRMHTLGSTFVPPPFHAGGLRYHGMAPMVSHLKELGLIEARAYGQTEVFAAGVEFARVEGIVPAPEANHAVKAVIDEAVRCREEGVSQSILFNLCGHGHFDMQAYMDYFAGKLEDHAYSEDEVAMALAGSAVGRGLGPAHARRIVRDEVSHDRDRSRARTHALQPPAARARRRSRSSSSAPPETSRGGSCSPASTTSRSQGCFRRSGASSPPRHASSRTTSSASWPAARSRSSAARARRARPGSGSLGGCPTSAEGSGPARRRASLAAARKAEEELGTETQARVLRGPAEGLRRHRARARRVRARRRGARDHREAIRHRPRERAQAQRA